MISNYPEIISLSDLTHMMSTADPVAISVETPKIDTGCSLEKEFTELIRMNPWMVYVKLSIMLIHVTVVYCWDLRSITFRNFDQNIK